LVCPVFTNEQLQEGPNKYLACRLSRGVVCRHAPKLSLTT
jgi:hypothetical protein